MQWKKYVDEKDLNWKKDDKNKNFSINFSIQKHYDFHYLHILSLKYNENIHLYLIYQKYLINFWYTI